VSAARNVAGNQRLTAGAAILLLVALAAESVTVIAMGQLLAPHIVIGMLLIPLVILKLATTGYRFVVAAGTVLGFASLSLANSWLG